MGLRLAKIARPLMRKLKTNFWRYLFIMSEFCFNVKQEILTKNIEGFAKRAAKYGVRYTVQPLAFDKFRHVRKRSNLAGG